MKKSLKPLVLSILIGVSLSTHARAVDFGYCRSGNAREMVEDCTALIESGILTDEELSDAYAYRAGAYEPYFDEKDVSRASLLSDLKMAIALNPKNAFAYYLRGEVTGNISDFQKVIELAPGTELAEYAEMNMR